MTGKNFLLAAVVVMGVGAVQASIIQTTNSNSTVHDAFVGDRSGSDLINAGQSTFDSASGTPAFAASGAFSIFGLNDGASAIGSTDSTGKTFYNSLPATITFTLDTSVNTLGYDIDLINSYAGWGDTDATQVNQAYEVLVSTVGSTNFTSIANVDYSPFVAGGEASTIVSLTDSTGTIASGVDEIRFVFADNQLGNGTVFQEIDVFGSAAVPEPVAATLVALTGIGFIGVRRIFMK